MHQILIFYYLVIKDYDRLIFPLVYLKYEKWQTQWIPVFWPAINLIYNEFVQDLIYAEVLSLLLCKMQTIN